ncbi:MAG TPA: copper amine oxidase N-terminal domain-containing protein [Anaerovoracaceae bacterium]|nr:copper amine oxidase N-terminal domain-containing protein [Anaerovoracaceae bacterium]
MKRKILPVILILALIMTSAVCSFAANNDTKNITNKHTVAADSAAKKEYITQKREQIKSQYTNEELDTIKDASEKIKKEDPDAKVLDIDSVISDDAKFKFDTPPVIKGGRTLIPVRAITEGFGAELSYDQENQTVTITKGDTVIELTLGAMVAVVNGQEIQMDTKANITNNRTYVPLRFVLETFKLSVEWDQDTETIEITDDTTTIPEDTTTDGAITTDDTATDGAITIE